ncbi:hypothetical protein WOLCODRAFT_35812, partial [Wolfiporia cocos MD-104 SS10]
LHHIAAILPIPLLLHRISTNAAIHIHTLPTSAQIRTRLPLPWPLPRNQIAPYPLSDTIVRRSRCPLTIVHHLASLIPVDAETTDPYYTAPWDRQHGWGERLQADVPDSRLTKDQRKAYIDRLQMTLARGRMDPSTLFIFTDGSRRRAGRPHRLTGAGYATYLAGAEVRSSQLGLGRKASIYDVELLALAAAAFALPALLARHPTVCTVYFL